VLILTGRSAADNRLQAWQLGADEFLTKPFHNVEVRARCRSLIRQKRLVDELDSAQNVVFALARAVEAKSPYTQGHADRVTQHAIQLGGHVGISEADMEVLRQGAILHDVGKIKVPDAILEKPGPLTKEEYDVVKQHPVEGVRIIESLHSIREAVPLVRWHHERMDGAGYPDGLFGGEIPLLVRILAVADVYDALGSARPYRPALPQSKCMAMLQDNAVSGGLDPELVRCFADHLECAPAMPPLATCP
jgi:putative two-component system response regulator